MEAVPGGPEDVEHVERGSVTSSNAGGLRNRGVSDSGEVGARDDATERPGLAVTDKEHGSRGIAHACGGDRPRPAPVG